MSIISWDEFVKQQKGEYELTLNPENLRLGDQVVRIDDGGRGINFPAEGRQVETFEQKEWFKRHCRRVTIDLKRCLNRRPSGTDAAFSTAGALPAIKGDMSALGRSTMSSRKLARAWSAYRQMSMVSQSLILSFHQHGQVDLDGAREAIHRLLEALPENLAALIWLTRIREKSRYTFQHGLNVAILGAAYAHAAGWERKIQQTIALAGLLHDLGKVRVSLKVLNKEGPLSKAESEHVRLHTSLGHELLSQNEAVPQAVSRAVLYHHERPDGKGYPEGLTQDGIPALARLIGILDAYDAMTSIRFHRPAFSHQQALGTIWKQRGQQFDTVMAEAFCRFLGAAPPGTLLRLPDDRIAVALQASRNGRWPVVRQLHHRGKGVEFGVEIDLSELSADQGDKKFSVTTLPEGFGRISMRELSGALPGVLAEAEKSLEQPDESARPVRDRRRRPRIDAPKGTKVLVIDDALTIRRTLEHMLSQASYRVSLAEDATTGLELAAEQGPDLIVLDIVLPDLSGFRALRRLRRDARTRHIPVIMISGNSGAVEKFFLQRVGADDFIQKPFGRLEVFSAIERLVRAGTLPKRMTN
jgi:response regulator RpfG family c-di-GMP phosphodiesterase